MRTPYGVRNGVPLRGTPYKQSPRRVSVAAIFKIFPSEVYVVNFMAKRLRFALSPFSRFFDAIDERSEVAAVLAWT